MAVTSDIDDLPGALCLPGITSKGRAFRRWSTRELCQVAMTPTAGLSSAQFVDMTIPTSIYHLPGAPCFPGIADKSNTICCRGIRKLIHQVCIAPRVALSYDQFVDMAIAIHRTDIGNLLCASIRPGIASHNCHL